MVKKQGEDENLSEQDSQDLRRTEMEGKESDTLIGQLLWA